MPNTTLNGCVPRGLCLGEVILRNAWGVVRMSCNEFHHLKWNYPSEVTYNGCTEVIKGKHPCDGSNILACHPNFSLICFFVSLLLVVLLLFCFIWVRIRLLRHHLCKGGCSTILNTKGLLCVDGKEVLRNYPFKKLLIWSLIGGQLTEACIQQSADNPGLFLLSNGNTICTTGGNYTVHGLGTSMNMALDFETFSWEYEPQSEWGCAGGSCPSLQDCEKMDSGNPTLNNNLIYKTFCTSYFNACAFGRGCTFGQHKLHLVSKKAAVYSLQSSEPTIYLNTHKTDCVVKLFHNPVVLQGPLTVVKLGHQHFICPYSSNAGDPRFGELGDLQVKNKSIAFNWQDLACGKDWYKYDHCRVQGSFLKNIERICSPIPGPYAGVNIKLSPKGHLFLSDNNPALATIQCMNSTVIEDHAGCDLKTNELWGVREHSTGVFLVLRAVSYNKNQDLPMEHPCNRGKQLHLPCDGKYYYYPIDEWEDCHNTTDKTSSDQLAFLTGMTETSDRDFVSMVGSSPFGLAALITSFTGGSLIWILILLVLCRR